MAKQIVNAAPMVIDRGTQDLSTRLLPRDQELVPQHLPKFYVWAEKGPVEPQLVVGGERDRIYGSETFNPLGKFANHATIFANLANSKANICMIERLIPADAGPEANLTLWLDVLDTDVDNYQRNSDYSLATNAAGDLISVGKVAGHLVKWVVTTNSADSELGLLTQKAGDQVAGAVTSQRYPIFEFKTSSKGAYGNNTGIRISAPTIKTVSVLPENMMKLSKAYPYNISVIHRQNSLSSPKIIETLFGEQRLSVSFKPGVVDTTTSQRMYIGDKFIDSYQNIEDLRYPKLFGEFSEVKVYDNYINTLTSKFQASEIACAGGVLSAPVNTLETYLSTLDFTSNVEDNHLFNFVSGLNSLGNPYASFQFAVGSANLSENTNHYAGGGSDGTINNYNHDQLVYEKVLEYLDPNNKVQELAINVESIMYDSGYSERTKKAMVAFITERKDTFLVLGTHYALGVSDPLQKKEVIFTASEENSLAITLLNQVQNAPESDYFGTPVMRAMIIGRSGKLRNSAYKNNLPLTAEILLKSCAYMGASDGRWKNGLHFDGAPGSVLEYMYDINVTWVPAAIRNRNWDVGLNWVQSYDRRSYFFPALKTVYDNDTSVLNSYFTAMAICQLNKVAHAAWREFTGTSGLTNGQLEDKVNNFVNARVIGRFDNRFVIKPDATHSDMDVLRGYSWTLPIKIYAPNMKTVMTTFVQAYRIADLDSQ